MTTETKSHVDVFFNFDDAVEYIYELLGWQEFYQEEWFIKELEIKMMDSGAYRAGIVFEKKQMILFEK